ncbi:Coiled-coil domain-containing protein 42A [Willisornis vidua]|uniref:Coiled-coil domain-containing protein 42A n=1 Tax=Willisornis vidua TaxID=1566151 RepID=A0ABQ9D1U3_9PASS|nr:Coiled-coil domain-containing protein 42A [Willisornis vidua]
MGKHHQENDMLRNEALRKAKIDREGNIKRDNELLRDKKELEALRKHHQKLCKKLLKYSMFKRYLEDVVENSQFQDIEEITLFYQRLMRSRKELLQSQQWHKELTEKAKMLLEQYRTEKEAEILQCKNDLVQLKQYLDQARRDVPLWEDRWADIQNRAAKKAKKLKAIEMAIHNLFQSASTRMNARWRVAADDSHKQLSMVKDCTGPPVMDSPVTAAHAFQAELRWNVVFVDAMEDVVPLLWYQGHVSSLQLGAACLGSPSSGGAAVGSMNNDGKLDLSEKSGLWTLAGDLGRKGKRWETMSCKHGIFLVPSFSNGQGANPVL